MHAVIDTNILIYDTFEDLDLHEEAKRIMDSLAKWRIPDIVLYEYAWFFKNNNLSASDLKTMLTDYTRHPKFKLLKSEQKLIVDAVAFLEEENLPLSYFNDALILQHASLNKLPLATFDKKLRKLASKRNIKLIPETGGTLEE